MNKIVLVIFTIFLLTSPDSYGEVKIGSKTFTESVILGEIINNLLNSKNIDSSHNNEIGGTRVLWSALLKGDIDLYPEYTGTLFYEIFSEKDIDNLEDLKKELSKQNIRMSDPLGFNNTYAIGVRKEIAKKLGIRKISDLKKHPDLNYGFNNEFLDREDGWPGLRQVYGLEVDSVRGLTHDLAYKALGTKKIDVADIYATDAEIQQYGIKVLEDDRNYFSEYFAVVLYKEEVIEKYTEFEEVISLIEGRIDQQTMIDMNSSVKIKGNSEIDTAQDFLRKNFDLKLTKRTDTLVSRLTRNTKDHMVLVAISLSLAILISIPLGIMAYRFTSFGQIILGIVGIIQTIPSLAILVFMIPFFGIGTIPALAALFLYSLLPIVRNTYSGFTDIPRDLKESADALGISPYYKLVKIELPLAARSILAGIKTSAVINVGTATLGALIGAGGYGQPILTGIRLDDINLILEGAVPAAVLALLIQGVFDLFEFLFIPRGLKN